MYYSLPIPLSLPQGKQNEIGIPSQFLAEACFLTSYMSFAGLHDMI